MKKFSEYPFSLAHEEQKMLARYAIEDNDTGKVVEDMKKTQKTPIIRSILIKIIGETTIYTE